MAGSEHYDDRRNETDQTRNHGRNNDGSRPYRSHFEAAQYVRFTVLNGAHSSAEKAAAEHPQNQDHVDNLRHAAGILRTAETDGENREKHQWEEKVEKQNCPVAGHQPQIGTDLRQVRLHASRSLLPVSSMNTSSSVGRFRWISVNWSPSESIHLRRSAMVLAGLADLTVTCLRFAPVMYS